MNELTHLRQSPVSAALWLGVCAAWLLVAVAPSPAEPQEVADRFYSADRKLVAEVLGHGEAVQVMDMGSGHRAKVPRFDYTVKGAVEFYDGNEVLAVSVGSASAGNWPLFFRRGAGGDYERFGVNTEVVLPEAVADMLPKGLEAARMFISCEGWEGRDTAKIRAAVRPTHPDQQDYDEPFVFTFNVVTGKVASVISKPLPLVTQTHPGQSAGGNGTGFYVDRSGWVVTARHIVENANEIEVVDPDGARHAAKVEKLGADDLALLTTEARPAAIAPLRAAERPTPGARLCTFGCLENPGRAGEANIEFSEGAVAASGTGEHGRQFQFSAPLRPGNAGGAMLDDTGALVGVITGGETTAGVAKTDASTRTGVWTDGVLLLLPAGWSQADAPSLRDRAEAIRNLRAATVEVVVYKNDVPASPNNTGAIPVAENVAAPPAPTPAAAPRSTPLASKAAPPSPRRGQITLGDLTQPVPGAYPANPQREMFARAKEADRQLTVVYTAVRSHLNATGKEQLKGLQLQWLRSRSAQAGGDELLSRGATADTETLRRFSQMDEARTAELRNLLNSMR